MINVDDYGIARDYANNIKTLADTINDVFDNEDLVMQGLFSGWESTGAENTKSFYAKAFKELYPKFYANVETMHKFVMDTTASYEDTDKQAENIIAG